MNILEARSFWVNNFFNFAVNIHDITCKTKLVLFSTNFTLALSRSVSELVEDIGSLMLSASLCVPSAGVWWEERTIKKLINLKIYIIFQYYNVKNMINC